MLETRDFIYKRVPLFQPQRNQLVNLTVSLFLAHLTSVLYLIIASLAATASAAGPYPVKEGLNCRSEPNTGGSIVTSYAAGTQVTITCATHGEAVNGHDVWDKTTDGCFVSDWYVSTGTAEFVAPECNGNPGTPGGCPNINDAGVELIKSFEGCVANPYQDAGGKWTVGYGHLCSGGDDSTCSDTGFSYPLTEETATELFKRDLPNYVSCMPQYLTDGAKLNKNQWAALTSFCYNLGCGILSDFAGRLNAGEDANIVIGEEFPKYTLAEGVELEGLVRRRNEEVALAQSPGSTEAWPNCAAD